MLLCKGAAKRLGLALFFYELLQLGDLQILSIEAQIVVEHLGKYAKYRRPVFVAEALDVDVEEDGVRLSPGGVVNHPKGVSIILELPTEALDRSDPLHVPVLQEVGEHLEKVRLAAAEEAGDPYADVCGVLPERCAIVAEECPEVLFQLARDDILIKLLDEDAALILIDLDHAVDLAVDVLCEHIFYHHNAHLFRRPIRY